MNFTSDSLGASRLILLFALALTCTLPAQGQTSVWLENPVDNRFDRAANWSTGIVPGSAGSRGDTAEFGSSSITSLTLEDHLDLEQIIFAADADPYTIDMGARHEGSINLLDGDIINYSSEIQTFDLTTRMLFAYANAGNENVHYHIQGPYGLVHFYEGVAGDATYQLSTGGRVWFERSSSGGDSRFIMDGGEFRLLQSAPVSIGSLEGSGGEVIFNDPSARLLVGSLNTDTTFGGSITEDLSGDSGTLEKIGTGTLSLTGTTDHTGGTVISDGTLQIGDGGTSGTLTGDVTNNANLAFNRSDDITFDDIISGTGELIKKGSGTLTLGATNTYEGDTTIEDGTVRISNSLNVGDISGVLTFDGGTLENTVAFATNRLVTLDTGGGTFNTTENLTLYEVISGTGQLTKSGSSTLTLNGSNIYSGGTVVEEGTLRQGVSGAFVSGATDAAYTVNGGTLDLNNYNLTVSSLDGTGGAVALGSADLTVDQTATTTYDGVISGAGSLTKQGSGALALTGENTYSGGTTVSEGTLLVNNSTGSATGTGNVVVDAGATLGGAGSLAGDVTLAGILTPGNSPGAITIGGDLTMQSTSLTIIEIASLLDFDQILIGGELTYGGDLLFDFSFMPEVNDGFTIFDSFTSQSGAFDSIDFSTQGFDGTFDYATGALTITAVPEPSTWALLLGALALGFAMCNKRRI